MRTGISTTHIIAINIGYMMCCDNGIINENNATEIFNEVDLMIRRPLKGFFDLHQLKDFISKKPIVNECPYNPIYRFK